MAYLRRSLAPTATASLTFPMVGRCSLMLWFPAEYLKAELDIINLPFATCSANQSRSSRLNASGLSIKIGTSASMNGLAMALWFSGSSRESKTASTLPIRSSIRSTTVSICDAFATCRERSPSCVQIWETRAPSIPKVSRLAPR